MTKKVVIPIYEAEKDYWQEQLNMHRGIRAVAAYSMMYSGFEHWKEDISFDKSLNIISYPETMLVYKVVVHLNEEDELYRIIEKLRVEQGLPMSKSARFFMFYDWRFRR